MGILKVKGKNINYGDLIISLLITLGGATCISFFIVGNFNDGNYVKPWFSPPDLTFKIVWPILYALIAVSAYRIYQYKKTSKEVTGALFVYSLQLLMNFAWPIVFFKLNLYGLAFIIIIFLLLLAILTFIQFLSLDKISGFLFIPYVLWLSFATLLSFFIWKLNEM